MFSFLKNLFKSEDAKVAKHQPPSDIQEHKEEVISEIQKEKKIEYSKLPPYEPKMDLPDYEYPDDGLSLKAGLKEALELLKKESAEKELPVIWTLNDGSPIIKDLIEIKNLLVCGTQETGKTTFLNQLLISLLLIKHPSQVKLVLADVKGVAFDIYHSIEKFFLAKLPSDDAIIEDTSKFNHTLAALCIEMDHRYDLLKNARVRNIKEYNERFIERRLNPINGHQYLPFIVLIIDDLGGFTLVEKDELNTLLQRLVTDGYKVGIFTIISTSQFNRTSLTQDLLSVIAERVVFSLNSKENYKRFFDTSKLKTVLDQGEFLYAENNSIQSGKSVLFDYDEIEKITNHISSQKGYRQTFLLPEYVDEGENHEFDINNKDPLFEDAARLIVQNQVGSTSLIQRRMKLGYNRAGRILEQLEAAGIVGPNQGSNARDVLIKSESELDNLLDYLS